MLRSLICFIICNCLIILLVQQVYADQGDVPLQISISPTAGEVGTIVTVTGNGVEPGRAVRVVLAAQANPPSDIYETVEFSSNPDGSFAVSLTIPTELANGTYYIRVEQTRAGDVTPFYYYNRFEVGPVVDSALLPKTGIQGEQAFNLFSVLGLALLVAIMTSGIYAAWQGKRKT